MECQRLVQEVLGTHNTKNAPKLISEKASLAYPFHWTAILSQEKPLLRAWPWDTSPHAREKRGTPRLGCKIFQCVLERDIF